MMSLAYPVDRLDWALFSVEIFSIIGTDFVSLWQWFWSSRCKPSITSILVGLWQFISRSQGHHSSLRKILIQPNHAYSWTMFLTRFGRDASQPGRDFETFSLRQMYLYLYLSLVERKRLNSIIVGIKITICFGLIRLISWLLGENFRCP